MKKYLAVLPWFPGFYESPLSAMIDGEMEYEMQGEGQPGDEWYRAPKTWEEVDKMANYKSAQLAITKAWVEAFSEEVGLAMEMESLQTPKEYNFTTDRPFIHLPYKSIQRLKPIRKTQEFKEVVKDWFTSYDGFMSFYDNDTESPEWRKPIREYDHNQLSALIAAYALQQGHDRRSLVTALVQESRVYEAAQHVWDKPE